MSGFLTINIGDEHDLEESIVDQIKDALEEQDDFDHFVVNVYKDEEPYVFQNGKIKKTATLVCEFEFFYVRVTGTKFYKERIGDKEMMTLVV